MSRDVLLIAFAVLLILFGGLFAGAEAALSRVSRVTADEMERAS
jgi:CBS domain containing-hemolysin-like protein